MKSRLLPYETIFNASCGDERALECVLAHYRHYINKLASRDVYEPDGSVCKIVDDSLRLHLETHLLRAVMKFRAVE